MPAFKTFIATSTAETSIQDADELYVRDDSGDVDKRITWGTLRGALGESIILPAQAMYKVVGSAVMSETNRHPNWLVDKDEGVAVDTPVPSGWATVDVVLWWTNRSANSGNVSWLLRAGSYAATDTLSTLSGGTSSVVAAPSQNVLASALTAASGVSVASDELLCINVIRSSSSDTLTGDVGLLAVQIVRAS